MILYLSVIGVAMLLIAAVNIALSTALWYNAAFAVVFCTALQFAFDGILAIIINKLPDRLFGIDSPHFAVSEAERRLYNKLGVRRWKDKVWELGSLGGFSKKTLASPESAEYIERFIIECNKGVVTHRLSYPIGFLAMLFVPSPLTLTVALPTAAVNLILNVLPTIVLRYNTPKLKALLIKRKRIGR